MIIVNIEKGQSRTLINKNIMAIVTDKKNNMKEIKIYYSHDGEIWLDLCTVCKKK